MHTDKLSYEMITTSFAEGDTELQGSYVYAQILKFAQIILKSSRVPFL